LSFAIIFRQRCDGENDVFLGRYFEVRSFLYTKPKKLKTSFFKQLVFLSPEWESKAWLLWPNILPIVWRYVVAWQRLSWWQVRAENVNSVLWLAVADVHHYVTQLRRFRPRSTRSLPKTARRYSLLFLMPRW